MANMPTQIYPCMASGTDSIRVQHPSTHLLPTVPTLEVPIPYTTQPTATASPAREIPAPTAGALLLHMGEQQGTRPAPAAAAVAGTSTESSM